MAKCYSCGKNFDYEKYYGICPKCGAYNKETTSVEEHKELHQQYDEAEPEWDHYEDTTTGYCSGSNITYNYEDEMGEQTRNMSTVGIVVCVLLSLGILAALIIPFALITEKQMQPDLSELDDDEFVMEYEEDDLVVNPPEIIMDVEFIEAVRGEDIFFRANKGSSICVEGAKVIVPANQVPEFPENEKLVAISVSYCNEEEEYYLGENLLYAGYGNNVYKQLLGGYFFEGYEEFLTGVKVLETIDLYYSTGNGEFLVFVPEDITEIKVYIETKNPENKQQLNVYYVPLEIQEGGTYE